MKPKTHIKLAAISLILICLTLSAQSQNSVSLKSQWLDPTNLFTEKVPTAEFISKFSVGGLWTLYFYYAHDIEHLTPVYLIGGVNNTRDSDRKDSLQFSLPKARVFQKYSRNIFVSYQYSETIHQLSWIQPIITWNWNFIKKPSRTIHTLSAEISGWMSIQRKIVFQDGGYISGKYSYEKHFEKWILSGSLSLLAIKIFEPDRNPFVLGEVLNLSTKYIPFNTTLEIVLNKPLITEEESELGFTVGLIKEF